MSDISYWLRCLRCSKKLRKKVTYSIIPKYFNSIKNEDNGVNIKVIYWKLDCENSTLFT